MPRRNALGVGDCGQVDARIPFNEQFIIPKELFFHIRARFRQVFFKHFLHQSDIYFRCSCTHLSFIVFKTIISTLISAGETPEIRLACPILRGLIALSFCLASILRPEIAL